MADNGADLIGRLVYLPERSVLEPLVVERTLPGGRVEARALEESEDLFLDRDKRVEAVGSGPAGGPGAAMIRRRWRASQGNNGAT
jgi:hypothetical protein